MEIFIYAVVAYWILLALAIRSVCKFNRKIDRQARDRAYFGTMEVLARDRVGEIRASLTL